MQENGCSPDQWKQWRLISRKKLNALRENIYGVTGHKLTVEDFPDSFRNNRVFVENVEFSDKKAIQKIYRDLEITPEIVTRYIEEGTVGDSEYVLVNILRARQLTEALKVPDIASMANDLRDEGNSVVIFVNFKDSVKALCSQLNCKSIEGGQSLKERQQIIDDFQDDVEEVLVVNISAGGTGLSLHDINGKRPRVSLICPSYSAKEFAQTLGRIHRNGAKSDALQKILVAVDTIEENVIQSVNRKLENLKTLHGR
jgi:SNF2 family DNA or RNA helicase